MKVKQKIPETFEDFAYQHNMNPEDIDDYSVLRILPKDYKTKIKYAYKYYLIDQFYDDLYDVQVEIETRLGNRVKGE